MATTSATTAVAMMIRRRRRRRRPRQGGRHWCIGAFVVTAITVIFLIVILDAASSYAAARAVTNSNNDMNHRRALVTTRTGCLMTCCHNCGPSNSAMSSSSTTFFKTSTVSILDTEENTNNTSVITLTMEGIGNNVPVTTFYEKAYGITFDPDALALIDLDAGGSGNFAYEPSSSTTLQFYTKDTIVMNVQSGIAIGMSFYYSSITRNGSVTVFDGPNGTGNVVASQTFYPLGFYRGDGDPRGDFNRWRGVGLTWDNATTTIAKSVVFKGAINRMLIDDITLGSATSKCPDNATMSTFELWNGDTDSRTNLLKDGGSYCLRGNWNVRVKTVHEMATCGPVLIKFFTGTTALRRKVETEPNYFLFGDDPVTRNVYGNTQSSPKVSSLTLVNGTTYCIRSTEGNRTGYSQVCFLHRC